MLEYNRKKFIAVVLGSSGIDGIVLTALRQGTTRYVMRDRRYRNVLEKQVLPIDIAVGLYVSRKIEAYASAALLVGTPLALRVADVLLNSEGYFAWAIAQDIKRKTTYARFPSCKSVAKYLQATEYEFKRTIKEIRGRVHK